MFVNNKSKNAVRAVSLFVVSALFLFSTLANAEEPAVPQIEPEAPMQIAPPAQAVNPGPARVGFLDDLVDDDDSDGIVNFYDNCYSVWNPSQGNRDGDGRGDACDLCPDDNLNDSDEDGYCADIDNCPLINNDQHDWDSDGVGDACDPCPLDTQNDTDSDGLCDNSDNCPFNSNPDQIDTDNDGHGDVCDTYQDSSQDDSQHPFSNLAETSADADCDGVSDSTDNCPFVANPYQEDSDSNGVGDACTVTIQPQNDSYNTTFDSATTTATTSNSFSGGTEESQAVSNESSLGEQISEFVTNTAEQIAELVMEGRNTTEVYPQVAPVEPETQAQVAVAETSAVAEEVSTQIEPQPTSVPEEQPVADAGASQRTKMPAETTEASAKVIEYEGGHILKEIAPGLFSLDDFHWSLPENGGIVNRFQALMDEPNHLTMVTGFSGSGFIDLDGTIHWTWDTWIPKQVETPTLSHLENSENGEVTEANETLSQEYGLPVPVNEEEFSGEWLDSLGRYTYFENTSEGLLLHIDSYVTTVTVQGNHLIFNDWSQTAEKIGDVIVVNEVPVTLRKK